jgi:hypothetical protein
MAAVFPAATPRRSASITRPQFGLRVWLAIALTVIHPLGGTGGGGGTHCTSHTFDRSTSGHCAATCLRCLARSSSGVRDAGFSIIDSLSRSCRQPSERARCSFSASDSSSCIMSGFALHDPAMIFFRRATSAGRSASAK